MTVSEQEQLRAEALAIQKAIVNEIDMAEKSHMRARYEEIRAILDGKQSVPNNRQANTSFAEVSTEQPVSNRKLRSKLSFSFFSLIGFFLMVLGVIGVIYFWFVFEYTVEAEGAELFGASSDRVVNFGLLSDRIIGTMVSSFGVAVGVVFFALGELLRVIKN